MARLSDNSGESFDDAIVVEALTSREGVSAEYTFLATRYGRRGVDWELVRQSLVTRSDRRYDVLDLQLVDGSTVSLHFEITAFYGKP